MNQPGGGKNDIPNRLKRQFSMFNMTVPTTTTIDEIYGQMVRGWYSGVSDLKKTVLDVVSRLVPATIKLWAWTKRSFLPTPTKFHYVFSMRELSSVTQGLLRVQLSSPAVSEKVVVKLWRHECERVFADKVCFLCLSFFSFLSDRYIYIFSFFLSDWYIYFFFLSF
jgi:dynein heavy chain